MDLSIVYPLAHACPESVSVDRLVSIYHQLSAVVDFGVPGAVVELGCYRGITSQFMRRILDNLDPQRELHLFDTFAGLPNPGISDGVLRRGDLAAPEDELLAQFQRQSLTPPVLHRGYFCDTLPAQCPHPVCFAYIDADLEASIQEALEGVYPHVCAGGVIMIDDYCNPQRSPRCWAGLPGVRIAVDRFFADKPERIVCLPGTGDLSLAFVRKRARHASRL
jgi:O-methyltransferase